MKIKYYILLYLILLPTCVISQTNIDSLFNVAIEYSKEKDYESALNIGESILLKDHSRYDVQIFMANVYAWQEKYDLANEIIEQVYDNHSESQELYDAWLNILLWNKDYKRLLEIADTAEKNNYHNKYNLSLKKIIAYTELKEYEPGLNYIKDHTGLKDSAEITYLYHQLLKLKHRNVISAYSLVDYIPDNTFQYFGFMDYNRVLGKNNLLIRLNYTNKFDTYDFMPEIDYYQYLSKGNYLYFNFGYGIRWELFPKQRAGIEYYTAIKKWELSLGGRFLNFNNNPVYMITSKVEKYFSRSSLALRPYYAFQEGRNALSLVSTFKIYGKKPNNYSGIQLAYGNSPDEGYNLQGDISLENYWIRIENNFQLSVSTVLNVAFRYTYEETTSDNFRNRYSIELLLKQRF